MDTKKAGFYPPLFFLKTKQLITRLMYLLITNQSIKYAQSYLAKHCTQVTQIHFK